MKYEIATDRAIPQYLPTPSAARFRVMPEIGSLMVGGQLLSPRQAWAERDETEDVFPLIYKKVRNDVFETAPVPVSRVAIRRNGPIYSGVIDSYGVPVLFSLSSRGCEYVPASKVNTAWQLFDEIQDEERQLSLERHRRGIMKALVVDLSKSHFKLTDRAVGGKAGGRWFTDKEGCYWFGKQYHNKSTDRLCAEHLASVLYRLFGVRAPETCVTTYKGLPMLMAKEVPGNTAFGKQGLLDSDAGAGFVIDCWLGNWEVVGPEYDNMLVEGSKAARIDTASVFMFNSRGKPKEFKEEVHEIDSMRNPEYPAGVVFAKLSDQDVMQQILKFGELYKNNKRMIDRAIKVSGLTKKLADRVREALHARAAWLVKDGMARLNNRRASSGADVHKAALIIDLKRALPKKEKPSGGDTVKKQKAGKASSKKAGAAGKTRYNYPGENANRKPEPKKAGGAKDKPEGETAEPGSPNHGAEPEAQKPTQQPVVVPSEQKADPQKLATQLGIPLSTLKQIAGKFKDNPKLKGRSGFVKFMGTRLKELVEKHKLTADYFGLVYDALTQQGLADGKQVES